MKAEINWKKSEIDFTYNGRKFSKPFNRTVADFDRIFNRTYNQLTNGSKSN